MKKVLFLALLAGNLTAQPPILRLGSIKPNQSVFIKIESKNSKHISAAVDSVFFNSTNGGLSWEVISPLDKQNLIQNTLPKPPGKFFEWQKPIIGPDSLLIICGIRFDSLVFQKSNNFGQTWSLPHTITRAKNAASYLVNGRYKSNGLPVMACDMSNSAFRNRIYICWSDEKSGAKNKDVFISYSDDKGESWIDPIVVTYYPNHKEQFMPSICVDQTNGNVYVIYYDQQNYPEAGLCDLVIASSNNGCQTFNYYRVNKSPLKCPVTTCNLSIDAVGGEIRALWGQDFLLNKQSAVTAILHDSIVSKSMANELTLDIPKMMSYSGEMKLNVRSKHTILVAAALYKPLDSSFEKILFKNKKLKEGNNTVFIEAKKMALERTNYVLVLYYNNRNQYLWITTE